MPYNISGSFNEIVAFFSIVFLLLLFVQKNKNKNGMKFKKMNETKKKKKIRHDQIRKLLPMAMFLFVFCAHFPLAVVIAEF